MPVVLLVNKALALHFSKGKMLRLSKKSVHVHRPFRRRRKSFLPTSA